MGVSGTDLVVEGGASLSVRTLYYPRLPQLARA